MQSLTALIGLSIAAGLLGVSELCRQGIRDDRRVFRETTINAQADYNAAVRRAADVFKEKLRHAVEVATKAGHLDEAVALRDELNGLEPSGLPLFEAGANAAAVELTSFVPGTWNITYCPNKWQRKYIVSSNGDVSCDAEHLHGRIQKSGGFLLLDFGEGKLERLTFVAGRLFVEHFLHKEEYPATVFQIGVGWPVPEK